MANIKITLVKSTAGCLKDQIATAEALGLHKIGSVTIQPDNEMCIRDRQYLVRTSTRNHNRQELVDTVYIIV